MKNIETHFTVTLKSNSAEETEELGRTIGVAIRSLQGADLAIALTGDLGAGKTTFTRGLAAGLGLSDRVTSPTFTLINEYGRHPGHVERDDNERDDNPPGSPRLIHMDTYRLGRTDESAMEQMVNVGFEDILDELAPGRSTSGESRTSATRLPTVLVIEWAERIAALLPTDHLEVQLLHRAAWQPALRTEGTSQATADDLSAHHRYVTFVTHGPRSAAVLCQLFDT